MKGAASAAVMRLKIAASVAELIHGYDKALAAAHMLALAQP